MLMLYCFADDPNNKCGYESIWIGLKCKNSHLIDKYKLSEMTDLYKLLRYGNDEFPSLFDNKNVKNFIDNKSVKFKKLCYEFKEERLDKNTGGSWEILQLLASIYFEIYIFVKQNIIYELDHVNLNPKNRLIIKALNECNIFPQETLEIIYTKGHVEYSPLNNENDIYLKLKNILKNKKQIYDELKFSIIF